MFRLRNWYLEDAGDFIRGFGECYGNPRFCEGYYIHTSRVQKIETEEQSLKLFTKSGSCYVAAFKDANEHVLEHTQKALQLMGIPFDVEKCKMLMRQRTEDEKCQVSKAIYSSELYVKMAGGRSVLSAYFKMADSVVVEISVVRHESFYSDDSILVTDWKNGLCDWRIFPMGDIVRPYHWSDGLKAVSIENIGDDFIFKGSSRDILCKHGTITRITDKEYVGEELLSPDAVNGKNILRTENKYYRPKAVSKGGIIKSAEI